MRVWAMIGCVLGLLATADNLSAQARGGDSVAVRTQGRPTPPPEPACCSIVRIDTQERVVTARETATGFTFRFEPRSRRTLSALKVGQPIWADFTKKTVKLKAADTTACCAIMSHTSP